MLKTAKTKAKAKAFLVGCCCCNLFENDYDENEQKDDIQLEIVEILMRL